MNDCSLKLYIRGMAGKFRKVALDIQRLCDEMLGGRARLEIVDLQEEPHLAQELNIFMVPTLIKDTSEKPQRYFGSFENTERLRRFLAPVEA